ncbi:unnamed protein product [Didymodactylos carnosus]|uniref:Uncharacterized protein n=1 Tax=Didymodactylos carnosus TaxID=1234261 RepID=A0A813YLL5_9BILA|nr:unnamed protein product [Didymodactylos carnosus]CAF3671292.1 unnamed protein product [Didymodactylos carnosus]
MEKGFGEPGGGKTTLLRWLTLEFAGFLRQGETEKFSIEGRNEWETLAVQTPLINCSVISFARIPILIRTQFDAVAIEWILRDLAVHLYNNCPSGWIDTFDLIRLAFISLKALVQQRGNGSISNDKLNKHAKDFVDLLSCNVVGFATARGLDAYGFVHRTLEEYFVALTIVSPLTQDNVLSAKMMVDRILNCMWKAEYHEPLALAIGWLDLKWQSDDMNAFCLELMERRIGSLPIGCLLLTDVLRRLDSSRSSRMLTLLFTYILFSSAADDVSKEYLRQGLDNVTQEVADELFENLLHDPSRIERTCEFLIYCMEPIAGEDRWVLPSWMRNSRLAFLATWDDKDVNVETVVDLIFRRSAPLSRDIDYNILQSFLIDEKISGNQIHPAALSVIIALCGGIVKVENSIIFDPFQMHRVTPLAPLLIEYFKKDMHAAAQDIQWLLNECEIITFEASADDDIVQKHQLEWYTAAIIQTVKTTKFEYRPEDDELSTPVNVDFAVVRTAIEKAQERISKALSPSEDMRAADADLQLFSAALSIIRMCQFTHEQKELFEEAARATRSIQDGVLRILCVRHMCQIVGRWPDTALYDILRQILIEDNLRQLSHNLPLIIKALVLVSCIEEGEKMHPLLNQLFDNVVRCLNQSPKDEEDAGDQESVFQALRASSSSIAGLEMQIPSSFKTRSHLSDILELNSPVLHSLLFRTEPTFRGFPDNVLLCQIYIAELTVDTQTLMALAPFRGNYTPTLRSLNLTGKLFELWNWTWPGKKFSHHRLVSINTYLHSALNQRIEPAVWFDDRSVCDGIEVRDRSMIEHWLLYYNDKNNEGLWQFALLAVALLLKSGHEMFSSSVMERMFRILEKAFFHDVDSIRYQARTAFHCWYYDKVYVTCRAWSPWLWRVLRRIWSHSSSFPKLHVESVNDISLVLELESDRLRVPAKGDAVKDERFSFFVLIRSCSQNVHNYLVAHIRSVLSCDSTINDEYLATVIVHLVEVEISIDPELQNEHFFLLLKTIFYEQHSLPFTQRAALFALTSQEQGRNLLGNTIRLFHQDIAHKSNPVTTQERAKLTDNVLSLCLWALADAPVEHRSVDKSFFRSIEELSNSDAISRHAAACYGWLLWTDKEYHESIDDMQLRLDVTADFLYTVLTARRQCTVEREGHSDWCTYTVELLRSHWNELADRFLDDCYASLCASSRTLNRFNRGADFLFVACELAEQEPELFYQGVRKCVYAEEAFKKALYLAWKKGNVEQRRMCIELYSVFEVITVDLIDMLFTDLPDLYQNNETLFTPLNEIENREAIESLFPYLHSVSMAKRYLAANSLVHLAILEHISCVEVSQLLQDVLNDPMSNQLLYDPKQERSKPLSEQIRRLLLMLTCLHQVSSRELLHVLTPEKVIADFYECLEALRYPFHELT